MKKKQKKILQNIIGDWGRPKNENFNFDLIENFSTLNANIPFYTLNAQTIKDLDLQVIFEYIDRTNSRPGQQYLYDKLIKPTNDISALKQMNEEAIYFLTHKNEREAAQLLLSPLNNYDAYFIANLLDDEVLNGPKWSPWYWVDSIVVLLLLTLSIKFPGLLLWLMLPFAINIFLYFRFKNTRDKFNKSFPQLNNLINIAREFSKKGVAVQNNKIKESIQALSSFQKKFKILNFTETPKDELSMALAFLLDLIKSFFLIEIYSFFSCLKQLKNRKEDILNLFNYIGNIDAALSIASLRSGISNYTSPVFLEDKKEFSAKGLYHPLIKNCVVNDIELIDKSILITGSNMSGKSTFIRSVAINAILAQTIYTCFAEAFSMPILQVFSSIRITDNLMDARSYYFEEVNTIGGIIKESETPFVHLFILDEVFKGTNTIERVAGAKAILSFINKNNNLVFVSTHDIELAELLKNEFELFHFSEDINDTELVFDHKLKPGPLKTRNAIKILAISGYPAEIIDEANSIANKV